MLVDPHQMRQVLFNLLNNAIEAMPEGGDIELTVVREPTRASKSNGSEQASRPSLTLRVCDHGIGVPQTVLPRIFEPFVTTKENGTGWAYGSRAASRSCTAATWN